MSKKLYSYNPATKELVGEVEVTNAEDIKAIVEQAKVAQVEWEEIGVDERIKYLEKAGSLLNQKSAELAILLSKEMGKDINRSQGEVNGCANDISYRAQEVKAAIQNTDLCQLWS